MSTRIKIIIIIASLLVSGSAVAQTGTSKTTSALTTEINTLWPDQSNGQITPFSARQTLLDIINSYFNTQGSVPLPIISNNTVLGNVSGGSATAAQITATQLTTLCNQFTTSLSGCVPSPGGIGTSLFLRQDNTWAIPPGTSNAPAGANTQVQTNNAGAFGASSDFRFVDPQVMAGSPGVNTGQYCINGVTSGIFCQTANAAAGTWTATWPTTGGTNGFVLTTDGTGNLSWTNPVSGGTVTQVNTSGFVVGGPITTTGTIKANALAAPMALRQGAL